jgi:hypothetical protein
MQEADAAASSDGASLNDSREAVRAQGSNVTLTPGARDGSFASNSGSVRTVPLKYSDRSSAQGL